MCTDLQSTQFQQYIRKNNVLKHVQTRSEKCCIECPVFVFLLNAQWLCYLLSIVSLKELFQAGVYACLL